MADRAPLATYVNCWQSNFASLPCNDPILRAAWLILGATDFMRLLAAEEVPPERAGKSIFCSAQYLRIIATTRLPGVEVDQMISVPDSKNICIERNGHWYNIENVNEIGPEELVKILQAIKADADNRGPGKTAPGCDLPL